MANNGPPTCTLCNRPLHQYSRLGIVRPCNHKFHYQCVITNHVRGRNENRCPICRILITVVKVRQDQTPEALARGEPSPPEFDELVNGPHEEAICGICSNPLGCRSRRGRTGVCEHEYHPDCLQHWIVISSVIDGHLRSPRCLMCRGDMAEHMNIINPNNPSYDLPAVENYLGVVPRQNPVDYTVQVVPRTNEEFVCMDCRTRIAPNQPYMVCERCRKFWHTRNQMCAPTWTGPCNRQSPYVDGEFWHCNDCHNNVHGG